MGENKLKEQRIKSYLRRSKDIKQLKAKNDYTIMLIMWLRFTLFSFIALTIYLAVKSQINVLYALAFLIFIGLLFTIKRHQKLKERRAFYQSKIDLNLKEIEIIESRYVNPNPLASVPSHDFFNDLQLNAKNGLMDQIDRTISEKGKDLLLDKVLFFDTDENRIQEDQEIIEELKDNLDLRQDFWALQKKYEIEELHWPVDWFDNIPFIQNKKSNKIAIYAMITWSWAALFTYFFSWISEVQLLMAWSLSLFHISFYLKQIRYLNRHLKSQYKTLNLYSDFIKLLKDQKFQSKKLQTIHSNLFQKRGTDVAVKQIINDLDQFENRNNLLIGILLNALFQWDLVFFEKFKKWGRNEAQKLEDSLKDLYELEAYFSLANFSYNHDDFVKPEMSSKTVLECDSLIHFDLCYKGGVPNSLKIENLQQMLVLTGANMSGKSTFLRTIGISWVLAHLGLKVPAKRYIFKPMSLFTSMNNEDSLESSQSYFHAELSRLKKAYDKLEEGEEVFLLLDEILRGTNSKDKAEGSERFLKKIIQMPVSGIIATHDLSLTNLENTHKPHFFNQSFDVYFEEENIKFDYKLKEGASTHLNATYLLEKMNLI